MSNLLDKLLDKPKPKPAESPCGRCGYEVDGAGFCSMCGATTIAGKVVEETLGRE